MVPDGEMLRWYLTDSGFTALNQSLAEHDLSKLLLFVPVQGRVNFSILLTIPFASRLFLIRAPFYSLTSNFSTTGGGGFDINFSLASIEQVFLL